MTDFGTLRSLLHDGARDRETFDRIVRVFVNTVEPEEAERVWLPYALEHLAPWPDDARADPADARLNGGLASPRRLRSGGHFTRFGSQGSPNERFWRAKSSVDDL